MRKAMAAVVLLCGGLWFAGKAECSDAVLVEFVSPACAPCRMMTPVIQQLTAAGVAVRTVDVSREPELVRRYNISNTPTFVVISGGKELTRLVGVQTGQQLAAALAINNSGPWVNTAATTSDVPETRLAPLPTTNLGAQRAVADPNDAGANQQASYDFASPTGPEAPESDSIRRALAATVRLRVHDGTGHGVGTGTIIDTHGDEALVLTCGHLFRDTEGKGRIEVDVFDNGQPRTIEGQLIDYDADDRDIALVSIRPGFPIQPVPVIREGTLPEVGSGVFSFGCDRGDLPSRRDTRITGVNKYNQHKGASNLEIAGAPIDGRSGGGLFDSQGCLVGVCNAADYKGDIGIYAGPGAVQWQLDRVQLSRLYRGGDSTVAAAPANAVQAVVFETPSLAPPANSVPGTPIRAITNQPATSRDADQEMIIIIRDPRNPQASPKVMTLAQPSTELLQMLENQSLRR